jgi:hypothetical protein
MKGNAMRPSRLLAPVCFLFLLSGVCRAQFYTLPGSFGYSLNSIRQVFDISPDGKIAVALRNDPVSTHPAFLTTFDPLTGAQFDTKSFGFGPLGVQMARVGDSLRAAVLTSEGGPRRIYLFDIGAAGQLTQLGSTQLTTSGNDASSNIVLSGTAGVGFVVVIGSGVSRDLVTFSLTDASILSRVPTADADTLAMAETGGRRLLVSGSSLDRLVVVDATDPAHPAQIGDVALPRNTELSGVSTAGIAFSGDARYVFVGHHFIDLAAVDLTTMQVVGTLGGNFRFGRVRIFEEGGRRLLAVLSTTSGAQGQSAILLVDATDPAHLSVVNQFNDTFFYKTDIAFSRDGARVYAANGRGLLALDVPSMTKVWEQLLPFTLVTREQQVSVYGESGEIFGAWEAFTGNTFSSVFGSFPPSPPNVSVSDATAAEGDSGTSAATFTVSLSSPSTHRVSTMFFTSGGTATQGTDFIAASGTLTFEPGETTKAVTVEVIGDSADEFDEAFTLTLTNPSVGLITRGQGAGAIPNDDPPPSISIEDLRLTEGDVGADVFQVNVTLSAASGKTVKVNFSTADGTATAGSDYAAAAGTLTFNPGQVSRPVAVTINGETLSEGDETFFINLSGPSDATIARGQGVVTILNEDPLIRFGANSFTVNEGVNRSVVINVTRAGDLSVPSTVQYETESVTASDRADYTAVGGTLRFAPNETLKTITVLITDDRFAESSEFFSVRLFGPTGAGLSPRTVATVFINDNDASSGPSPTRAESFDTAFFVRQHYLDFLGREPDADGLAFWSNEIESCGADAQCREVKRVNVSAAFFLSIEFQETGFLAYRVHRAAFGDVPGTPVPVRLRTFLSDSRRVGEGVEVGVGDWERRLAENKSAYVNELVTGAAFAALYPQTLTAEQFVDALFARAGVTPTAAEREAAVNAFGAGGTEGRANALRSVAESQTLKAAETNEAFVLMQYFGYLRRNPDDPQDTNFDGYHFWLDKLNQFDGDFRAAEMVKAFIQSIEYHGRFGNP